MRSRRLPHAPVLTASLAVLMLVLVPSTANAAPATSVVRAYMTLYGYVDNSPPGTGIAHPCLHQGAGGTGTFDDPVTFATSVRELGWCHKIYVPYMEKYFIHEDECSECDHDWNVLHKYRFDMWAGGDVHSLHDPEKTALLNCENTWTRGSDPNPYNQKITVDPASGLPVDTAKIFTPPTTCWSG